MRNLIALSAVLTATFAQPVTAAVIGSWGVDLSDQDHSVRPGDDFFQYQNGAWVARAAPDVQQPFMSYWRDVRNVAPARLAAILDDLAADESLTKSAPESKAATLYRDFLDEPAIERLGHSPINPELRTIRALRTRSEVARYMGRMEGPLMLRGQTLLDGYGRGLFTITVAQDSGNPERNALYLRQGGIMLPDPTYYSAPQVADIRDKYQHYVETILTLIGWPAPATHAKRIVDFETKVAAASTPLEQLADPAATYHPLSYRELRELTPGFDWASYFAGTGMAAPRRILIDDPQAFARLAAAFASADIDTLRARQAFATADYNAALLSHDLFAAKLAFRTNVLNSRSLATRVRKDGAERLVEAVVPDVLGSIYLQKFVSSDVDARAKRMGVALRSALDTRLARAHWLGEASRTEARRKLAAMDIRVGYPPRFQKYDGLSLTGAGLYADVRTAGEYQWRELRKRLSQPFDRAAWSLAPMFPNYSYDAQANAAEVSAALFQPPFFDPAADDAVNYGAVGTIVASQIMHAFDVSGVRYDATGRLREWLKPDERAALERAGQTLGARYSAFEPLPGVHPRGNALSLEAMADIGSIEVALDAYHSALGGAPAPRIDGLTGDQRFFLGRTQSWRARFTDDAIRNQLTQGNNAIPWMRVNGPLPNIDAWYAAFGVKPGDKLYLPPDQRLHLW